MTDRPTNEEREKLLADARGGALDPQEAAELALLADVLADSSTWAEPRAGPRGRSRARRRRCRADHDNLADAHRAQ